MPDTTKDFTSHSVWEQEPGTIIGPSGKWKFTYDAQQIPQRSSHNKLIYRGMFVGESHREPIPARALSYERSAAVAFGAECSNLGRLMSLGVGPKLLAVTQYDFEAIGYPRPTIIEEDAGESLARLLEFGGKDQSDNQMLHPAGTPERNSENQKILFDVFVQMANAHKAGIFHRDLRCENVCVRRFDEGPADIKATIIDFDLADALGSGAPSSRAPLFVTLFTEVPSRVLGERVSLLPNPLELDMGYLAALQYHLESDGLLLNGMGHSQEVLDRYIAYLEGDTHVNYFGYYRIGSTIQARHIDTTRNIEELAEALELLPTDSSTFPSRQLLTFAMTLQRPYLDKEDMRICMSAPEARLAKMIDRLVAAKFETYKALRRTQGKEVLYERYDEQPLDLQRSNYAQAEHIPVKVYALGYLLVTEEDGDSYEEVTSFSDEQIEALARLEHERWNEERFSAGWTLDPNASAGNPEAKTSPYLVPYDELPDKIREYDRDVARQLIPLVKSAGLMVVRPR